MAARFGNVLYWTGCVVGALLMALALTAAFNVEGNDRWFFTLLFGIPAVVSYLIGRALKYVLAGL